MKSGYPDYPKFRFTQTIWPTENWCPKSGYPNTLYLEHFHHFSLHFYQYVPLGTFLYGKKSTKNRKKIILGRRICAPMQQCKNHKENEEENNENLWLYNWPKLRSFRAFVTVIEISIFGFENSTLVVYSKNSCTHLFHYLFPFLAFIHYQMYHWKFI